MPKILDISTSLRSRFWNLWRQHKRELSFPGGISEMSPEKAYRMGYRQGFWEGALGATKIVVSLEDHSEEEDM